MDAEKTGKFISELRKEKNMTQKQLAQMLYVSDKAVSRWETGKGFPEIGIIEDLSKALDVSMIELFKGERLDEPYSQIKEYADESFHTYKDIFDQQKIVYLISGFLISLMLVILVLVHLHSPITLDASNDVIRIETIADKVVAILDDDVCGYNQDLVTAEDKSIHLTCYTTKWYELFGNKKEKIVMIGDKQDFDFIYYYPSSDGDKLIYTNAKTPSYSIITLPRLVYNYWILIGFVLSVITVTIFLYTRKKYYSKWVFVIASFFVSFTISTILLTKINTGSIYNASYYFSGILLLSISMCALMNLVYFNLDHRKTYQ